MAKAPSGGYVDDAMRAFFDQYAPKIGRQSRTSRRSNLLNNAGGNDLAARTAQRAQLMQMLGLGGPPQLGPGTVPAAAIGPGAFPGGIPMPAGPTPTLGAPSPTSGPIVPPSMGPIPMGGPQPSVTPAQPAPSFQRAPAPIPPVGGAPAAAAGQTAVGSLVGGGAGVQAPLAARAPGPPIQGPSISPTPVTPQPFLGPGFSPTTPNVGAPLHGPPAPGTPGGAPPGGFPPAAQGGIRGRLASLGSRIPGMGSASGAGAGGQGAAAARGFSARGIGPGLGYFLGGQALAPLAGAIPGELGGVDIGDRAASAVRLAGVGAGLGSVFPVVGTGVGAGLGALAGAAGFDLPGGAGEVATAESARESLGTSLASAGITGENAEQIQGDFELLVGSGMDPQQALQAAVQSAMEYRAADRQSEERRQSVLAQQAIIASFMGPALNDARNSSLGGTAGGRSYLAALAGQTHAIPMVNEYLAEQQRQQSGLGSSAPLDLSQFTQ